MRFLTKRFIGEYASGTSKLFLFFFYEFKSLTSYYIIEMKYQKVIKFAGEQVFTEIIDSSENEV